MGHPASTVRFSRIDADSSKILVGDDYVGDVFAYDDILKPGHRCFVLHLDEDHRGPRRVHDRGLVRETAQRMVDTLWWR